MPTELRDHKTVVSWCDECNALSSFIGKADGNEFGHLPWRARFDVTAEGKRERFTVFYRLYRCTGCHRGAVGEIVNTLGQTNEDPGVGAILRAFHPSSFQTTPLPAAAPPEITNEFKEAERCASAHAFRAASAMLRSALEKTLTANGYKDGNLYKKIESAAADGIITAARRQRAHDNVRSLGNDVVHEAWRPVDETEFDAGYGYTQRLIEDFYEHRDEVLKILADKGRLPTSTSDS